MQPKIYLFRTHLVNLTNLFVGMVCHNEQNRAYKPCYYTLVNNKFFDVIVGDFAQSCQIATQTSFRNIEWTQHISILEEQVLGTNQTLIFGSHSDEQIDYIKNYFGTDVYTVGINLSHDLDKELYQNLAEYHVYLLDNNKVEATPLDLEKSSLPHGQRVSYYNDSFNTVEMIDFPEPVVRDYNIDVADFFNRSATLTHLENIGLDIEESTIDYYNQWLLGRNL